MAPGILSSNGEGLAHLAGKTTFTRIEAYGDDQPQRILEGLIEDWKERGRPTEEDLRVEAVLDGDGDPSLTWSWTH